MVSKRNFKNEARQNAGRSVLILLLLIVVIAACLAPSFSGVKLPAHAASIKGNALSLVEVNDSFNKLVLRATMNKTLVYVDRLYFDYSPLSGKRLEVTKNEATDYVVIDISNEAGEWAKVWGYVRKTRGIRPNDTAMREMELTYLEIGQYWEWRTFTNEERWTVTVKDGYETVSLSFDMNDRKDGAVYYIDGVYALPEHYYTQVAYWWDLTSANPELLEVREDYRARAVAAAKTTPAGEPLRLDTVELKDATKYSAPNTAARTSVSMASPQAATPAAQNGADGNGVTKTGFWIIAAVVVVVVIAVVVIVAVSTPKNKVTDYAPESTQSNITDPFAAEQRNADTPPAPTKEQHEEYNKTVAENPLTEREKEELEKRKEFSIDADAPTGQKLVKLKVKDADGILQAVYDENGSEVFVNRKTYTVGNATYAIINRETLLLIRWYPSTMELKDIVGNRLTVNVDNKLMNMDGVEPYSPRSKDDILKKLGDMGMYTSGVDPSRMLFRMDDDEALIRAMNLKENNIKKGVWETISSAFKNLFGGGTTSKSALSNFLDVAIVVGIGIAIVVALFAVLSIIAAIIKKFK